MSIYREQFGTLKELHDEIVRREIMMASSPPPERCTGKVIIGAALGMLAAVIIFVCGYKLGAEDARHRIADAIRSGRLTVEQRIDHLAEQIERGEYIPTGDQE